MLNRRIAESAARLNFDQKHGYLRSLLDALAIPIESQMLVFSKTSFQARLIGPASPRALYFNDRVAVGWVRGGRLIEVAAQDPTQGVIFYTLDQTPAESPQLVRRDQCLSCHDTSLNVPGMLLRSVFPDPEGMPLFQHGVGAPDHRTPVEERWGGWYVSGDQRSLKHMGNAVTRGDGAELETFRPKFHAGDYLTPHSDAAALMVFEHQMHSMNLLTRLSWQARVALHEKRGVPKEAVEALVDYMLFAGEARLPAPPQTVSGFREKFESTGGRDRQGRSLRQLDLRHRLLRYPCSYMIDSEAFEALPAEAKDAVYVRMWRILSGAETGDRYAHLSPSRRRAIVEILRETKKDLPSYFAPLPD